MKCGRYGHFARCCKGEKSAWKPRGGESGSGTDKQHLNSSSNRKQSLKRSGANLVECDEGQPCEKDSFVFTVVEEVTFGLSAGKEPVAVVNIGGISREVLVDFGSASNLVRMGEFNELVPKALKVELQPCSKKLYGYVGQELEIMGQFISVVSMGSASVSAKFIIVKKGRCLLGYLTAVDFSVLQVNRVAGPVTENCNVVGDTFVESLKAKFPTVFSGIGKLKNY